MYDLTIPRRIAERREELGLAAYELAKRAGISPSYLSLIEAGYKVPSERVAIDLARALGDDPELYRAWVETAGDHDLDSRVERLERMRRVRSLDIQPTAPAPPEGMREWQARRRSLASRGRGFLGRIGLVDDRAHAAPAERTAVVRVPLLEEGTDPQDPAGTGDTISIDASLLDADQDRKALFAYRVSSRSAGNVSDAVSPGDVLVFAKNPEGVDPGAIYAVRVRSRIVLTRIAYTKPTLLLMPGQSGQSPVPIPVGDERALRGVLAGVAVASIRSWPRPAPLEPPAVSPSLGRTGQLDEEGNIVRDCEWREHYGWRPVQRPDDLEYLIAHPGKTIRFRLLRDGRLRYVLEMNAEQWQEALGEYYGGPAWHRNGYIVAITKRKEGEYTEEFQERWGRFVREAGKEE